MHTHTRAHTHTQSPSPRHQQEDLSHLDNVWPLPPNAVAAAYDTVARLIEGTQFSTGNSNSETWCDSGKENDVFSPSDSGKPRRFSSGSELHRRLVGLEVGDICGSRPWSHRGFAGCPSLLWVSRSSL